MTRAKELLDAAPPDVQGCVTHHACNCASWRLAEWERLVNVRLPDYEAALEAAQAVLDEWDQLGPTGTQNTLDTYRNLAAALARLRSEVPA